MPPFETMDCFDYAFVWTKQPADRTGNFRRATTPITLECRWVSSEKIVQDSKGNTVASPVQLILLQDVPLGSIFRYGGRVRGPTGKNLPVQEGLYYMSISFSSTEDIKGLYQNTRRECSLIVVGTSLPA